MKLNELIMEATKNDFAGCDADSILAAVQCKHTASPRPISWKKAVLIAAAFCLFAGTVSAAALLSGFGKAFDKPVDTGHVAILSAATDNEEVVWNITETWFDEYNLHIGGTVTTPEPLDPAGDHRVMCYFQVPGEEEHHLMPGYIFSSGECESPFVISGGTVGHGNGIFTRTGFAEDEIILDIKLCLLHDYALVPKIDGQSYFMEDYVTVPGEWAYTVKLVSRDSNVVTWNGRAESRVPDSSEAVVTSVMLNAFTLEVKGENLTYSYDSTEGRKETPVGIWLKMKDGTLLEKRSGIYANHEIFAEYGKETDDFIIRCFDNPIDPSEVESIILHAEWATFPVSAERFLTEDGWEYYPSEEGDDRLEGWISVIEIPLG